MIDQQLAARSTSSRKQHNIIWQLRTNTAAFPVDPAANDRNSNGGRGTTATTKQAFHSAYTSPKNLLREKNHPPMRYQDECMPLISYVHTVYYYFTRPCDTRTNACHWFLTWIPCTTTTTFAWRSFTTGTNYPLVLYVEKIFPVFWYTLPIHYGSQTTSVWEIERISVCALTRTYITCKSTNYADVPELPPSRPGTQPHVMLLCGFFWRSNRNHYLLV